MPTSRHWLERARAIARDRQVRERDGACYVEGIRQVVSAVEGGHEIEAVLVDPTRLRSDVAWEAVTRAQAAGAEYVVLRPAEFERVSARDNPIGVAAIVRWAPRPLSALAPTVDGLYLVTDDVRDPGNLGTLIRTLDAAGGQAVIVHSGTDPAHPTALRAALGTTFMIPVYAAPSLDALFGWAAEHHVRTLATTARADTPVWEADVRPPLAVLVGNEGEGLSTATVERCDVRVRIPMLGTATSLNVSVAAGVVLYEARRRGGSYSPTPSPNPG
jgi:TrmH family RNA methyltransferase